MVHNIENTKRYYKFFSRKVKKLLIAIEDSVPWNGDKKKYSENYSEKEKKLDEIIKTVICEVKKTPEVKKAKRGLKQAKKFCKKSERILEKAEGDLQEAIMELKNEKKILEKATRRNKVKRLRKDLKKAKENLVTQAAIKSLNKKLLYKLRKKEYAKHMIKLEQELLAAFPEVKKEPILFQRVMAVFGKTQPKLEEEKKEVTQEKEVTEENTQEQNNYHMFMDQHEADNKNPSYKEVELDPLVYHEQKPTMSENSTLLDLLAPLRLEKPRQAALFSQVESKKQDPEVSDTSKTNTPKP